MRDKVDILAGFALTPNAMAAADISSEAKKFMVVMNAATSIITAKSPYMARTSVTIPQLLNDAAEVSLTVTSQNPAVAIPTGAVNGVLTLNFAAGSPNSQTFTVTPLSTGAAPCRARGSSPWPSR